MISDFDLWYKFYYVSLGLIIQHSESNFIVFTNQSPVLLQRQTEANRSSSSHQSHMFKTIFNIYDNFFFTVVKSYWGIDFWDTIQRRFVIALSVFYVAVWIGRPCVDIIFHISFQTDSNLFVDSRFSATLYYIVTIYDCFCARSQQTINAIANDQRYFRNMLNND